MKTKQIITIIVVLLTGILIGKFAFSSTKQTATADKHQGETAKEHWTCSMHPQIDMPEFGQCPICGMDLIPKETNSGEDLAVNSFEMSKNAMALANIETTIVGEENSNNPAENTINLSGKVRSNDKATAVQTAHFGGRIEKLHYKSIGEYVSKGSFIASLYSPELVTAQNEFLEALYIKEEQPELYQAVRNKLKNWKISEDQINKIEQTKKVIKNFSMFANVSGFIEELKVAEGDHVKEGTLLFKVANLSSVWLVFDVYENEIKNIKKGQQIQVKVNAYSNKVFNAKVDFINPVLNEQTRTIEVRASIANKQKFLKPGMLLTAKLKVAGGLTSSKENSSLLIPKTAVLWTGKRSVVYVKTSKDKPIFEMREVRLGASVGTNYQVLEGLQASEEIVANGTFTVDATAQLLGKKSMMNRGVKEKEATKPQKMEEKMKCGEGKCGEAMKKETKPEMKCGEGKCGEAMKKETKTKMKCGEGKCGK